jgi:Tfp pilus assembly protein PilV
MQREAGFSLIEATLAVALLTLGAGGVLEALITATHVRATPLTTARLLTSANNLITDLRAATAYESAAQAQTFALPKGSAIAMSQPMPGGTPLPMTCTPSVAAGILTVTCTDAEGHTAQATAFLGQQAPAPGSTILFSPQPTP